MDDLQGPFYITVLGLFLAFAAFASERMVGCNWGATSARGRRTRKKNTPLPRRLRQSEEILYEDIYYS